MRFKRLFSLILASNFVFSISTKQIEEASYSVTETEQKNFIKMQKAKSGGVTNRTHIYKFYLNFVVYKSDGESVRFVSFCKHIFEMTFYNTKNKTGSEKAAAQNQELQMLIAYKFVFAHTTKFNYESE